ncbi:MAG TPA: hypothetical protein VGL06_08460 [Pseudonocardiaceae bacterium]
MLADDDDPALTEGPTNPTGRPGFRAPHVSIVVGDTGCPLWICDGEWQCAAVDLPVQVLPARRRPVGTDGRLATRTASVPSTPAIRPDGVVAWCSDTLPNDPAATLTGVLDRGVGQGVGNGPATEYVAGP